MTAGSALRARSADAANRPHILLLMADQFRGDCWGAPGTLQSGRRTSTGSPPREPASGPRILPSLPARRRARHS